MRDRLARHRGDRRAPHGGPGRLHALDRGGELGHRGCLEESPQRYLQPESLSCARDHLRREKRVSSQLEKIVLDAHPLTARSRAQIPASVSSIGSRGATKTPSGRVSSGAGNARRSSFPLDVIGRASRKTNVDGTM